jgi:hypothetical protein
LGRLRSPAWRGDQPCTAWKYRVLKNTNPSRANPASRTTALAVEKARSRKNRNDSMGWGRRLSVIANAASRTTPAASIPTISGEPQPRWLLSINPRVTLASPRLPSSRPGRSRCLASGSRDSATTRPATTKAATPTGRFT